MSASNNRCQVSLTNCQETLAKISEEGKEIFTNSGVTDFTPTPCINDDLNSFGTPSDGVIVIKR